MTFEHHARIIAQLFPKAELIGSERLTGGVSADVYRLDLRHDDGTTNRVVLRAHGATHSGHPAALEHQLLKALYGSGLPVPEPLMLDTSGVLLPDPFLMMEFVEGSTAIPAAQELEYIDLMAEALVKIHESPTSSLPQLPERRSPLPEVCEFRPEGPEWQCLWDHLRSREDSGYVGPAVLLHGDFWPENLLWRNGTLATILDWEDAAIGDPLSDVAAARVELRYKFGIEGMQRFTEAYASHRAVDLERLALWQVYVSSAAQKFMGEWRLDPDYEAHMRSVALESIREAGHKLMKKSSTR